MNPAPYIGESTRNNHTTIIRPCHDSPVSADQPGHEQHHQQHNPTPPRQRTNTLPDRQTRGHCSQDRSGSEPVEARPLEESEVKVRAPTAPYRENRGPSLAVTSLRIPGSLAAVADRVPDDLVSRGTGKPAGASLVTSAEAWSRAVWPYLPRMGIRFTVEHAVVPEVVTKRTKTQCDLGI